VTFSDTSADVDGTIASRAWDLNDDGAYGDGTGNTTSRAFATAGSYTVALRVTDNDGLQGTKQMTFTVRPSNVPPSASFTRSITAPIAGDTVTFTDTSTDSDGTIAARAWELNNDGAYDDGTGTTANRLLTTAGSYTVGLRVTDNDGAATATSMTFNVSSWFNVQHRGQFSSAAATTFALAPTSAVTAGDLMVVALVWGDQTISATVTDSRSNTWVPVGSPTPYAGSRRLQLFYTANPVSGATTITATFSAAVSNRYMGISEFRGMSHLTPLVTSGSGGGTALSGSAPMTATANDQLVFALDQNGAGGIGSVTGVSPTLLDTGPGANSGQAMDTTAGAATTGLTFQHGQSGPWAAAGAVFAPAGVGG